MGGGDLQTLSAYIEKRHKQKLISNNIEEVEIEEVEEEKLIKIQFEDDNEEEEDVTEEEVEEASGIINVEERPPNPETEREIKRRTEEWSSESDEDEEE